MFFVLFRGVFVCSVGCLGIKVQRLVSQNSYQVSATIFFCMETKEVRHVDVWSAAKLSAAIYLVISIIAGIITAVVALLNMAVLPGTPVFEVFGGGIIAAVVAVIVMAVIGMIVGFICGAIMAVIYNLAAGVFGGLKVDLE